MNQLLLMSFEEALEQFEPVLGFEVHVELNTRTKMFCGCANEFASEANVNTCPACLGLPGGLPQVNQKAIESSIRLGLALGCTIASSSRFARKNYFYPDTAKNFQTSQYDEPIAFDGSLSIELESGKRFDIDIERAHMEEDAGKLVHKGGQAGRIHGAEYCLVDYNRGGVPLIEIVTRMIEGAGSDAPEVGRTYVKQIRDVVRALGISHARMEEGNIRCDANVSLRRRGSSTLGTRTETKNVNSFRSIERAITYEIRRQATLLSQGQEILQETRHWHENTSTTSPGRPKSDADDYRYFPEPDLLPVEPDPAWVESLRVELPELPDAKRKRLIEVWHLTSVEFQDIENANVLEHVEATIAAGCEPASARKWWVGEITRLAKAKQIAPGGVISVAHVVELESLVKSRVLTDSLAKQVLEIVADEGNSPAEVVQSRGLSVVSDDTALLQAIEAAFKAQPDVLAKIQDGKVQAVGAIIGAVMKEMKGQADAARVRELVLEYAQQESE